MIGSAHRHAHGLAPSADLRVVGAVDGFVGPDGLVGRERLGVGVIGGGVDGQQVKAFAVRRFSCENGFPARETEPRTKPLICRTHWTPGIYQGNKGRNRADMAMMVQRKRKGHSLTQLRRKEVNFFIGKERLYGFYRLWCSA